MQQLLDQLQELPASWGLVAVDGNKRPYQQNWQANPLTKDQAAAEIHAGRAKAIGVIAGPTSDGLLFVDHDGISATEKLEELGIPPRELPRTAICTSGRDGRFQALFTVPERYWARMRNRRVFDTGHVDADGKAEQLDLRWNRHQSVVIGAHPITGAYRWIKNRSPAEAGVAEAPEALIQLLIDEPQPIATPLLTQATPPMPATVPLLEFITKDSRQLIESGGTPGRWNDDQLRLALDLQGTEEWILAQGHRPDISAAEAFERHISAAQAQAREFDPRKARHRFEGAAAQNPTPSTPPYKLESRLRFHTRTSRRILTDRPSPSAPSGPEAPAARGHSKPVRMENHEILRFLPDRLGGQPRLNIRTRDVHLPDGVITADDAARLYLTLSNEYEKWPKEPTFDAVQHLATASSFDPVADYLTGLEGNIEPLPDEEWHRLDLLLFNIDDPVAAAFLPRFFISAVARTFQPGCFGRQWPVIIGDKGIGKSDLPKLLFNIPGLPEGFIDNPGDLQREGQMKAHRSWCVELAELNGISRRADKEHLKAFLSERSDTFRTPWSRAPASHPRRFVFWGTSNGPPMNEADPRFVCIPLPDRMLPFAAVEAAKDALWARAVAYYRAGVCWHTITEEFKAVLRERNEDHTVTDPWADQVANYLARREQARELPVNVPELMDLLKLDSSQRNNAVANRLIELASSMGWFKGRRRPAPGIEQRRGLWPKGWA